MLLNDVEDATVKCAGLRSDYARAYEAVCHDALRNTIQFHWSLLAAVIYSFLLALATIYVNIRLGGMGQYDDCTECLWPGVCIICGKKRKQQNHSPFTDMRPRAVTVGTAKKFERAAAYSTPVDYISERMGDRVGDHENSKIQSDYEDGESGRISQHKTRMF